MFSGHTEYELYEKQSGSKYDRRCIDGRITGCGNCVGYCKYYEHPGFLTPKLQKQHNCLGKRCFYYLPKARSVSFKPIKDRRLEAILLTAQKCVCSIDDIRIMHSYYENEDLVLDYVSVFGNNNLPKIKELIEKCIGVPIRMVRLNYSFDMCVDLILNQPIVA